MKQITIDLPDSIAIGGPDGRELVLNPEKWEAPYLLEAALHGIKQRRTDRFSVVKSQKGLADAIAALAELDAAIKAGTLPTSGGGGGARISIEDAAWIEFFEAKDSPVKIKDSGKKVTCNGKTLARFLGILTENAIRKAKTAELVKMSRPEQETWRKETLPGLIADKMPDVRKAYEAGPVKPFIESEQRKRNGEIEPEAFDPGLTF